MKKLNIMAILTILLFGIVFVGIFVMFIADKPNRPYFDITNLTESGEFVQVKVDKCFKFLGPADFPLVVNPIGREKPPVFDTANPGKPYELICTLQETR